MLLAPDIAFLRRLPQTFVAGALKHQSAEDRRLAELRRRLSAAGLVAVVIDWDRSTATVDLTEAGIAALRASR